MDEDFVNLYKARKIIEKLIKNKFGKLLEADHDQSPVKNENDDVISSFELDEGPGRCIHKTNNMVTNLGATKETLTLV